MTTQLSFKNLLSVSQLTHADSSLLIQTALSYKQNPSTIPLISPLKIAASLFFEPSTRTRFSFESAMLKLGGHIINLEQGDSSSISKGESLEDMGRIMSMYADIIIMRHPTPNSVKTFATHAQVSVINAGDGNNEHPTQTLVDLMTIFEKKGRLENLQIGLYGDLKYARTTNSLIKTLSSYSNNTFHFISTSEFCIPPLLKQQLPPSSFHEHTTLESCLNDLDILYVTRNQTERYTDTHTKNTLPPITNDTLKNAPESLAILHPLPRVTEIHPSVDTLPQAAYFDQANNGLYSRLALLSLLLQ